MALRPNRPQSRADQLAERQSAQQDVFMREVDDALRQDEMLGMWQRYGKPAGLAIGAGLLALAGYLWWESSAREAAGERGETVTRAIDQLDGQHLAEADKLLAPVAAGKDDGSGTAARLLRAGIALEQNRKDEATRVYTQVAEDTSAPQPYRDLANVRLVALDFDTMKPEVVVSRMKPLAVPGNAWFGSAGELLGMAYLKQGHADLAGPLFAAISRDKGTPETLKRRARQMAGVLGVDAIDDVVGAANGGAGDAAPPAAVAPPAAPQN